MTATEKSDKLPISYKVQLMKVCENCTQANLEIRKEEQFYLAADHEQCVISGVIYCENDAICRRVVKMYEGAKYDSEGIPEQDTNI